jgi:catechol 2,3-dioxygenase-like lactoylglutathione lyase family enzyme
MRPMLMVLDLKETIDFYTDLLGFEVTGTYPEGEEPFWAEVTAGDVRLMFSYDAPHTHDDGEEHLPEALFNGSLYFHPAEALEELHARVRSKWDRCGDIMTQPYGMKEFTLQDPNGYYLTFGVEAG